MICLKKAKKATMIGIIVVTALVILMASFTNIVNASEEVNKEETSTVSTENKTAKKERKCKKGSSEKKVKLENLTDEEKETKKAEKKAKFENMTDEEKEALKNKKTEKKKRKNNNVVNSQSSEQ